MRACPVHQTVLPSSTVASPVVRLSPLSCGLTVAIDRFRVEDHGSERLEKRQQYGGFDAHDIARVGRRTSPSGNVAGQSVDQADQPTDASTPTGYTHVVEVTGPAKTVYIAGQVALDVSGKVVGAGNMKAQTEQVFKNLEAALKSAGATFADIVKMNTYVTDISELAVIREVRSRTPHTTTRASTLVQVSGLARPELVIEIEVIAAVSAK